MTDLRGRSVNSSPYLPTYLMYYGTHFLQEIAGPPPHTRRVLGSVDYLCSLLERKRIFFKDSGKTAKLKKRTEQLSNDNFNDNISCLNERNFFVCSSHLWN